MSSDPGFLGTGWAFPPTFDIRSRAAGLVSAAQDVRESLRILMLTHPGERVMHPTYGCGLRRLVFEQVTSSLLTEIRSMIERSVLLFEPRVELEAVQFDTSDLPQGVLRIRLDYSLRSSNTRDNLVFPLYVNGGGLTPAAAITLDPQGDA
jgi:uncharacterized protein